MSTTELITLVIIGLSAGIISGLLGVGGAIVIVPALVYFFGMTQHQAQGTSIAILLFPIGLLAFWNYYRNGYVNFRFAIVVMVAFLLGGYLGSLFSAHIPDKALRILFGILLFVVGAKMIFEK